DGYVLLLALLSIFIGGTLVLLSGILILCRRCCEAERRHSRASDDPEKTNTTYLEDSQPAQAGAGGRRAAADHPSLPADITIKVEDPECLSSSSYRDAEGERFLSSSSSSARRVSFNEAALFEQSKKSQEKGRRYTLTEGDFHHLKNARLTHLHLPPALKIVTIHECESSENSLAMTPRLPPAKPGLAIFQQDQGAGMERAVGDAPVPPRGAGSHGPSAPLQFAAASRSGKAAGAGGAGPSDAAAAPAPGTVLQFFTRLRRHASLDGASPYFRIKKWKLESNQRASSLDTRGGGSAGKGVTGPRGTGPPRGPNAAAAPPGSPKRRQFQRQRAASESMEQEDRDPHQTDIIQYIARTDDVAFRAAGPFLPSPASPPASLGRYFSRDAGCNAACGRREHGARDVTCAAARRLEAGEGGAGGPGEASACHDLWSLRASLELYAASERSNDQDSVRSDGGDSIGSAGGPAAGPPCSSSSLDEAEGPEEKPWGRPKPEGPDSEPGTRKLLQMDSGYASIEAPARAGDEGP
ncbi:CBARP protein, partial [Nothocercus julius]|nr:CBARP protein [Nothocercus julius]